MPDLSDWQHIKQFLETPWLGNLLTVGQILWGVLGSVVLGTLAWFYKRVLQAMYSRLAIWVRGLPVKIYARLGVVTQAERLQDRAHFQSELFSRDDRIARLEKEIEALKATHSATVVTPAPTPVIGWTGPKTIQRFGVKFGLVDPIGIYLGKYDPSAVPNDVIKAFLHGPFCRNCNYALTDRRWTGSLYEDVVIDECSSCSLAWQKTANQSALNLKRHVYKILDAEFRSNGKIAETDVPPGSFGSFMPLPKKPW